MGTRGDGKAPAVLGDNPIQRPEDDVLARSQIAEQFARQALALDLSEGAVVGVLGPWGAGKTSFINLARPEFRRANATLLDYNPWVFSGAEQLVGSFFSEIAAQLRLKPQLADLGSRLESYGELFSGLVWIPVLGPWLARGGGIAKVMGGVFRHRKEGLQERRKKLVEALAKLESPLVVVVDDIDRLTTSEIREVFRLVRLTASFPNVIYIVAFDRLRVESALAEAGVPGRVYLEKILQLVVDLPLIPGELLNQQILSALDNAVNGIERPGRFDEHVWPDVFMEIVRPLIQSLRDVRRYAIAVNGTVRALDGQVALVDVLALEAVRLFLPDTFYRLDAATTALTTPPDLAGGTRSGTAVYQAQVEALVQAAGERADVVRGMIRRLFPAAERYVGGSNFGSEWRKRWLRDRRVGHELLLRLYLERVAGAGLHAFNRAERAWSVMADRQALEAYLRTIQSEELQDVIASLEAYEDQFAANHVVPGVTVLLNLLPVIPKRSRGMFGLDTALVVTRVTYRLLKVLGDPEATEAAVSEILPNLASLSSRLELINQVGHREGVGHRLISVSRAAELEREWRVQVRASSPASLASERDLLRVLLTAKRDTEPSEDQIVVPEDPEITRAVLREAVNESFMQSLESRAVHRQQRLAWKSLVELYGDEPTLLLRIASLKESGIAMEDELELAEKYSKGWRPPRDLAD